MRHNRIQPLLQYGCAGCVALRMRFFPQNFGTIKRILPGFSSPSHREGPGTWDRGWVYTRAFITMYGNHDNKVYIFKMASYRSDRRNPLLSLEQMLAEKTTLRTQKLTHRNIICKLPFITLCCVVNVYFYSRVHSV